MSDAADDASGGHAQGLLRAGERRRPPRVGRARPVLRGLAGLPRRATTRRPAAIYAAAASEWHGAGVWRSADLGETWELSSEGLGYGEDSELKLSKISGLTAAHGRLLAGGEGCGVFESRDGAPTWSLLSTLDGQPGREDWNDPVQPAARAPRHAGDPARAPRRAARASGPIVQGFGIFETTDDGASWTPRNRGLRADWPLEDPEVGYCVHKLVMSPARPRPPLPAEPRRHAPQRRRRAVVGRDHRGAADRVRLRRRRASARPRQLLRHPARPRPRALHARGHARGLAHAGRRLELAPARSRGCRSATRTSASCARAWRSTPTTCPGLYFGTSTGQVFASADEGESWDEIASYLPAISSVEVAVIA